MTATIFNQIKPNEGQIQITGFAQNVPVAEFIVFVGDGFIIIHGEDFKQAVENDAQAGRFIRSEIGSERFDSITRWEITRFNFEGA